MANKNIVITDPNRDQNLIFKSIAIFVTGVFLGIISLLGIIYGGSYLETANLDEVSVVKFELAKSIALPSEDPTIAAIRNVNSLRETNADFYKDANNGDYLVVYSQKAIIYNLETKKIINVAPIIPNTGN